MFKLLNSAQPLRPYCGPSRRGRDPEKVDVGVAQRRVHRNNCEESKKTVRKARDTKD